jgi:hypothetical protein
MRQQAQPSRRPNPGNPSSYGDGGNPPSSLAGFGGGGSSLAPHTTASSSNNGPVFGNGAEDEMNAAMI